MNKKGMMGGLMAGLMVLAMIGPASAAVGEDGDFQFFHDDVIEGKMNDFWKASVETEYWVGDSASKLYKQETLFLLGYKVNDWLDIAGGYRQVFEFWTQKDPQAWFTEYRPTFDGTLKYKWEGWELADRSRFEYRAFDREDKDDVFSYRNRLMIKAPWKWTQWNINPFIFDEVFIQEHTDFSRNRLDVGVTFDLIKHVSGALFYRWQRDKKGSDWNDLNILGTALKFSF